MDRLNKIERLKDILHDTDYKPIKNYECSILGLPLEYDPQELHTERQAIRDEINLVENMTDAEYWEAYPEEVEEIPEGIEDFNEIPDNDYTEAAEPLEEGLEEEGDMTDVVD